MSELVYRVIFAADDAVLLGLLEYLLGQADLRDCYAQTMANGTQAILAQAAAPLGVTPADCAGLTVRLVDEPDADLLRTAWERFAPRVLSALLAFDARNHALWEGVFAEMRSAIEALAGTAPAPAGPRGEEAGVSEEG